MLALSSRPVTDGRMIPLPSSGLELHGVQVTYGERRFLHGFDLQVRLGELVVVTGPPGCGKTTLAGIASGLVDADQGTVSLDGIELADLDPAPAAPDHPGRQRGAAAARGHAARQPAARRLGRDRRRRDARRDANRRRVGGRRRARWARRRGRRPWPHGLGGPAAARLARACSGRAPAGADPRRRALRREPLARDRDHGRVRQYLPQTAILYITRRTGLSEIADRTLRLEPAEHLDGLAAVAQAELLDGSTEQQVAGCDRGVGLRRRGRDRRAGRDRSGRAWSPRSHRERSTCPSRAVQGLAAFDPRPRRSSASCKSPPKNCTSRPSCHRRRGAAACLEDRAGVPGHPGRGVLPWCSSTRSVASRPTSRSGR